MLTYNIYRCNIYKSTVQEDHLGIQSCNLQINIIIILIGI